jgi:hypothetical protein
MPDQWEEAAKQFTPAPGTPPQSAAPAPTSNDDWKVWQAPSMPKPAAPAAFLDKAKDAVGRTVGTVASDLNPVSLIKGIPAAWHQAVTPADMGPTKDAIKAGNYGEAFKRGIGTVPLIGPPLETITRDATEGRTAVGAGAPPLAESALGIRAINRAYGRTPGLAALRETSSISPGTIAAQAQGRLGDLNTQLEKVVGSSNAPVDLGPSRDVLANAEATARSRNAGGTVRQLQPMQGHLSTDMNTGLPLAPIQSPSGALALKRGFGDEFIHNWNPETMKDVKSTAAKAYHVQADALHQAVPESADLDKRASSLIPVAQRAEAIDRGPGIGQRSLQRIAVHTGAGLSAFAGYKLGGIPGAIAGGLIPEVITSPQAQMIGARALDLGGRLLKAPITGKIGLAGSGITIPQERQ